MKLFHCSRAVMAWCFMLPFIVQGQVAVAIRTQHSCLLLKTGVDKKLYQVYFGPAISEETGKQLVSAAGVESYQPGGVNHLFEPAIRLQHSDGNPSLSLLVDSVSTDVPVAGQVRTRIVMKDPVYPVRVVLQFVAYPEEDVIASSMEVSHAEQGAVRLYNFASSMLHFQADHYYLTQFHGDWAEEMRMQESELTSGIKVVDSKLGSRADMYQSPFFFLSLDRPSTEDAGSLIAGTLAWTGNFQFLFEMDNENRLNVLAGMNPYASEYLLAAGKAFWSPEFIFSYSGHGRGMASRQLHQWAMRRRVLDGEGTRLTLLNNWEATQFNFSEKKLDSLFVQAKTLGVDMFLLDDGWFGNKYPRNSDHTGLGDWQENKAKLPDGIGYLVKSANAKGVKFGIWVEPEMVSPKSALYEQHPDWVLKLPNRPEDYFRNQLVLDLVNPAVQDFVYGTVDHLLSTYPGIAYLKWDCNRMMTNTYSPYAGNNQSSVYIDYVRGFYRVMERLRAKYPSIPMMLCSGGGGRTDYEGLRYFTEFWPSDNTDPVERIYIQWGYSYFFPAKTIASHITSWGNQSLKYKTDVAMMGRMGYDIDISKLTASELLFSQQALATYKRLSPVIWQGEQYRLVSPYEQDRAVLLYADAARSRAVVFAYNIHSRYGTNWPAVKLAGLDPARSYTVREINLYPGSRSGLGYDGKVFTGEYLMQAGLAVSGGDALTSVVLELTAQ